MLFADLSFVNPCGDHITAAIVENGAAAKARVAAKGVHYARLVNDPRNIITVAFESGGRVVDGGFCARAVRLAQGLEEDQRGGVAYARAINRLRTRLSVVHWRANAINAQKLTNAVRRRVKGGGGYLPPVGPGGLGGGIGAAGHMAVALGGGGGGGGG